MTTPQFPLQPFLATPTGRTIREPAREIPVIAECDVAVLGGGTSGLCAAVAAARQGASVVLVEHYGFLGGMATSSLVNIWHSFYGMDRKTKIIGGVPDDLIGGLKRFDAVYNADAEGETMHWVLDSEKCKFVCDDLVLASGVKLMLHTSLAGVLRDGRRLQAALVESKSGRGAIVANTYIDCTGDADLVRFAGVQTQVGNAVGGCQAPSLCFRLTG
ncbi:MAG: FAD-dependent oxidoreductase, partial [Armatimonadia bacterium]